MTENLNRLTINCASLLQAPIARSLDVRPPFWEALSRAIANLANPAFPSSTLALGLPPFIAVSAPFMQLTEAVNYSSALVLMPVGEVLGAAEQEESGSWIGLWADTISGLSRLIEGMPHRFTQSLGQILASPRSTFTSFTNQSASWLNPSVIARTITEHSSQHQQSHWDFIQQAVTRSLTESSSQHQQSHWDFIQQHVTRSLTEISSQHQQSHWDSIQQAVTRSLTESSSQHQQSHWDSIQQHVTRSLTEISSQRRETHGSMPQSLLDSSIAVPQTSSWSLSATPMSIPSLTMTEFSSPNSILTQPPQKLAESLPPPPRPQAPTEASVSPSPITFNGGIHVQITAQTVDTAHADETARLIANQVLQEISRITEQSRFRRGLPPSSLF